MAKRKYDDMFLKPEITQAGDYQIFKMKGKDARGFDWMVRFAPITEKTYPADIKETVAADRVELYVGGNPDEIGKLAAEVEVALGKEEEKHDIKSAAMVYIPKGVPVKHKIARKSKDITWLLNFNLTPKYEAPAARKGGK
jgi:hypothetical protein